MEVADSAMSHPLDGASGEDSDQDLVTSYVSSSPQENGLTELQLPQIVVVDDCGSTGSDSPRVISSHKLHPRIFEDSLQQLHDIQKRVYKLRDKELHYSKLKVNQKASLSRLSTSCPSLGRIDEEMSDLMHHDKDHRSMLSMGPDDEGVEDGRCRPCSAAEIHVTDVTPLASRECLATMGCGCGCSCSDDQGATGAPAPVPARTGNHAAHDSQGRASASPPQQVSAESERAVPKVLDFEPLQPASTPAPCLLLRRRRSWSSTDQDDVRESMVKRALAKTQRSMSLSSLDSENDETFYDAQESPEDGLGGCREKKQRSSSGGPLYMDAELESTASSHSLNDYGTKVPNASVKRCENKGCRCSATHSLAAPRNTLHKSISSPSMISDKDVVSVGILVSEDSSATKDQSPRLLNVDSDQEDPTVSKRKKRGGSIFFRKKRGKEKENKRSNHQFVSVCYSNSAVCHVCNKSMAKKQALRCETCLVNVHEHSCKDQISDCSRFRVFSKVNAARLLSPNSNSAATVGQPPANLKHSLTTGWSNVGPTPASVSSPSCTRDKKNAVTQSRPNQQLQPAPTGSGSGSIKAAAIPSNKVISEEKEVDAAEDVASNILELISTSMESLDEGAVEINDLEDDPDLRLLDEEPEAWSATIDKKILKKLKDKDVKKQENIYELIITEKHHCLTLKIMQKLFAQGMLCELDMSADIVDRIFPQLDALLQVHLAFFRKLRERQRQHSIINNIGDLLLDQFNGESAERMKSAYGEFCSRHKDALSLYKDIMKSDRKFQMFIKKAGVNPLVKARGIPECILLVTQRITKYPLLIEALTKVSKENKSEQQMLMEANILVKEMLGKVNTQVAEKEWEHRLLEIYNKVDAKSAAVCRGKKFKKSDLLSNGRKLRYEGNVRLNQARGKVLDVTAVVLSDVIFFIQENNQKYTFATQDNKAGVISLQKLLVREKAGQDSKGIYLISSNPRGPEMYELICQSQKEKKAWIDIIRLAVENCPHDDDGAPSETEEEEEGKKVFEAKSTRLRQLLDLLHEKDCELARMCEDKMRILVEMMEIAGKEESAESPKYSYLVEDLEEGPETRDLLLTALQEASRIASSLYLGGTNLSRSVSSAGEHQSEAYVSPILPKRAETFGGFDKNPNKDSTNPPKAATSLKKKLLLLKDQEGRAASLLNLAIGPEKEATDSFLNVDANAKEVVRRASGPLPSIEMNSPDKPSGISIVGPEPPTNDNTKSRCLVGFVEMESTPDLELLSLSSTPPLLTGLGKEQWSSAVQLCHYLNTLMCLFSQHFTNVEGLKAQLALASEQISRLTREDPRDKGRHMYKHNQQLEGLRNLQEQLSQERSDWQRQYEEQKADLEMQKNDVRKMHDHVKQEEEDVLHQREQLYRYLETLQKHGFMLSPNMTVVSSTTATASDECAAEVTTATTTASPTPGFHRRSQSCDLQQMLMQCSATSGLPATGRCCITSPAQTVDCGKASVKGSSESAGCGSIKHRNSSASVHSSLHGSGKRDGSLPLNLFSATNQQKAAAIAMPVKQQLPLKLANLAGGKDHSIASSSNLNPPSSFLHQHHPPTMILPHKLSESQLNKGYLTPHSYAYGGHIPGHALNPPSRHHKGRASGPLSDPRHPRPRDPDSNQEIIYF